MKEWRLTGLTGPLHEALSARTKLPAEIVAQLLEYGAVVIRSRGKGSWLRTRHAKQVLHAADQIQVAYEPKVLKLAPFIAGDPIWENKQYGVWYKPAGVMSQGTAAGDQCSMLYAVEKKGRTPFLIHRLDRETEGPMLIGYTPAAAAKLSALFQNHQVQKTYQAIIVAADQLTPEGKFSDTLDGKPAETLYRILQQLPDNKALAELKPVTGRLHQLRRHLALNGSGVWGDPKYGKDNKNREGMKLAAVALDFLDPWDKSPRSFKVLPSFTNS